MSRIKTFARLKPNNNVYEGYEITPNSLQLHTAKHCPEYAYPHRCLPVYSYEYQFDHVFDVFDTQEAVFEGVAHDIIEGFLHGYNGTIFAYGQTGTGKTYTVEGEACSYSDRGLTPRALSMIYKTLQERSKEDITVHISYVEIYQEVVYDLLNSGSRTSSLVVPLTKVTVMEGAGGSCLMRNLSVHLAASEEVAQTLLLQGQTNRRVAETPYNLRSSRSHAVFTIYLAAKQPQTGIVVKSKLHLVDLAGSERVAKTGVDGHQLTEAKSINLSLHHLETVIVALQTISQENMSKSRLLNLRKSSTMYPVSLTSEESCRCVKHIPYRNSILTMVLRDSLGGNCQTAMIATISLDVDNVGETLSTCRFAQRVACVSNCAVRNEEIDDATLIKQLKKKVANLQAEVLCLRHAQEGHTPNEEVGNKLTDEDKIFCAHVVNDYFSGRLQDPVSAGIQDPYKFRECLRLMRKSVDVRSDSDMLQRKKRGTRESLPVENSEHILHQHVHLHEENAEPQEMKDGLNVKSSHALVVMPHHSSRKKEKSCHHSSTSSRGSITDRSKYKSPYELHREHEIQRLNRHVNFLNENCEKKQKELSQMKQTLALQELETQKSEIQAKLSVTKDQIAHQEAYIHQLKHTEADVRLLEQEKVVRRQLQKRERKFSMKLTDLGEQLRDFVASEKGSEKEDSPVGRKAKVEEKLSLCKNRDGTMNTQQVFDMLKSEERKTQREENKLEKEKLMALNRQLEIREAATRRTLQELKQMKQRSQVKCDYQPPQVMVRPAPVFSENQQSYLNSSLDVSKGRRSSSSTNTPRSIHLHKSVSESMKCNNYNNNFKTETHTKHEVNKELQLNNSGKNNLLVKGATNDHVYKNDSDGTEWDSAYSTRPSTSGTVPSINSPFVSNPQANDKNILHNLNNDKHKEKAAIVDSTCLPSEYIYGMVAGDSFDGRRMGFSSNTFESALTSMLERNDGELNYTSEFYNQFAREKKPKDQGSRKSPKRKVVKEKSVESVPNVKTAWGPEAKNTSIADRLESFLNNLGDIPVTEEEKFNDMSPRSRFTHRLEEFQSSPPEEEVEKIHALADNERETVYMSKAASERLRIAKIRKARDAAEIIQRAWRKTRSQ